MFLGCVVWKSLSLSGDDYRNSIGKRKLLTVSAKGKWSPREAVEHAQEALRHRGTVVQVGRACWLGRTGVRQEDGGKKRKPEKLKTQLQVLDSFTSVHVQGYETHLCQWNAGGGMITRHSNSLCWSNIHHITTRCRVGKTAHSLSGSRPHTSGGMRRDGPETMK